MNTTGFLQVRANDTRSHTAPADFADRSLSRSGVLTWRFLLSIFTNMLGLKCECLGTNFGVQRLSLRLTTGDCFLHLKHYRVEKGNTNSHCFRTGLSFLFRLPGHAHFRLLRIERHCI
jgi:hypothetical protein